MDMENAPPTLLTDRCLAALLNCGRATVWRRVAAGDLPKPFKIGGMTRWDRREVEAMLERAKAARDEAAS